MAMKRDREKLKREEANEARYSSMKTNWARMYNMQTFNDK